jgi:hypothetical protein
VLAQGEVLEMTATIDTVRLDKLLGMLTSGFGGEQANAATMIAKMAADRKMTVPELMQAAFQQKNGGSSSSSSSSQQQRSRPDPTDFTDISNPILSKLRIVVTECPHILSDWEKNFASDVAGRYSDDEWLSEKQLAIVNKILFKFEQASRRAS